MFKNLKQKVASEQKVRRPQSTPNTTPSSRSAKLPKPSQSMQPRRLMSKSEDALATSDELQTAKHLNDVTGLNSNESCESPDVVQSSASQELDCKNDESITKLSNLDQENADSVIGEKKVPFFKRLEFLTPLKDQVAKGLSESKESITSLVDEMRSNISNAPKESSKPDVVAQAKEHPRIDSVSDAEDVSLQQHNIDLSSIPKEQLLAKVMRLERTLHKYREKYAELSSNLREAKREREKLHSVMQQTQDKNFRRIQELKEQAELDLKAKMHLEEEFRVSLEEKNQLIQVQQTQIAILKNNSGEFKEVENPQIVSNKTDLERKVKRLEEQLKFAKETCESFKSQGDALQLQLSESLEEIENLNQSNSTEKSKLIKQLREAKNVIERIEEDKQTAVAEAKHQMHEILEGKDQELISALEQLKTLKDAFSDFKIKSEKNEIVLIEELRNTASAGKSAKVERAKAVNKITQLDRDFEDQLNKIKSDFDGERRQFVSEISHLKAEALLLNESMKNLQRKHESDVKAQIKMGEVALESQSRQFKAQMHEKENQTRLAIEEKELNKMTFVSQQDTEAQNLLKQLNGELEIVRQKVEELEKTKLEERKEYQSEITGLREDIVNQDGLHKTEIANLNKCHEELIRMQSEEFLKKSALQKSDYDSKLEMMQSTWIEKLNICEAKFADTKHILQVEYEKSVQEKETVVRQHNQKILLLESQLSSLDVDRASLINKVSELESQITSKNEEIKEMKSAYKDLRTAAVSKQQQLEDDVAEKDSKISKLSVENNALQKKSLSKEQRIQDLLDKALLEQESLRQDIVAKDARITTLSEEIECLRKEFSVKEQDILQKSANSNTEMQTLVQNMEALKSQKFEIENQFQNSQEKLKEREQIMKKHVLEMEDKHNSAISRLSSEIDSQKQEFTVKVAKQEKDFMELQSTYDETLKKFAEATARLKALAQKYKATVAEHAEAMMEKDRELSLELEKSKSLQNRMSELQSSVQSLETENQSKWNQLKTDFENQHTFETKAMDERFLKEKNNMEDAHQKELETVKITLKNEFTEEKKALVSDLTANFEVREKQLLNDAMEKFVVEKKNLEVKLQSLRSDASEKEKSLMKSLEDSTKNLGVVIEDNEKLKEVVRIHTEKISELQNQMANKENAITDLTQKNEVLCHKDERHSREFKELKLEKSSFDEKYLEKANKHKNALLLIESKDAELKDLKVALDQQLGKTKESSSRISELETQIEKFEFLLTEESSKFKSTCDSHAIALEKLNKDWQGKYSELEARAERKIAQLQQHLKSATSEVTSQCDIIQKLGQEKSEGMNEIGLLHDRIAKFEKLEKDFEYLQNKSSVLEKELNGFKDESDTLKSQMAKTEKTKDAQIEDLQKQLESLKTSYSKSQSLVRNLEAKMDEVDRNCHSLVTVSGESDGKLKHCFEELNENKKHIKSLQHAMEKSQDMVKSKDSELQNSFEMLSLSENRIDELLKECDVVKKNEQEKCSSLQVALAQNEKMRDSLEKGLRECAEKESVLINEMNILKEDCQKKLEDATKRLEGDSEKKVNDFKKKAEIRLAQIKKTFSTQLEEKLKLISTLEENKKALEQKIEELNFEHRKIITEKDSQYQCHLQKELQAIFALQERNKSLEDELVKVNNEKGSLISKKESQCQKLMDDITEITKNLENLNEEKKKVEESWSREKAVFEEKLHQEYDAKIQSLLEDEKFRYDEGQQQISDVKEHLEQVLQEAKLRLEETEKKLDEEKDRADVVLQEEKEKRIQSELKLSLSLEDIENERILTRKKQEELETRIQMVEKVLQDKENEISKIKFEASELELSHGKQLDAARKRSGKLEKDREIVKKRMQDTIEEYERKIHSLKDEIISSQKQVDVLSKTAVEDKEVEVERKLGSLKEDFERRLKDKEEQTAQNIKRLMAEYETQIHENNQAAEEKLEKFTQKNLAFQDSMRTDHRKELVFLQREIQSKEKQIAEVEQKYETEMHEMEKKMSDQVDKAMYRAMIAEKKLLESDYEKQNQELKSQVTELNKTLADTQDRERENLTLAQSLEARMSISTPLADPDKLEYLRRIMYSYIMGNERQTMAKVLILLLQFNELESQQILEKHGITSK